MILIYAGLLTLVALSHAGGDHTKGGGHIKGGHHAAAVHHAASIPVQEASGSDSDFGTQTFVEPKSTGVKGGSASVLIPVPEEDASGSNSASKKNIILAPSSFRNPIALSGANQPAIATLQTVKTVKTVSSASRPQSVKTVDSATQAQVQPVFGSPSLKATSDIRPSPLVPSGQIGGAREIIVYDDGTIVDVGTASGNSGLLSNEDLKPLIEGISGTGGPQEIIVYEDGTIEQVGGGSRASGQAAVKSGSVAGGNVANVRPVQKPATSPAFKPDFKIQTRPVSPAIAAPKPKPVRITPQQSSDDELVKINKELIQRQNQQGFIQTFGQKIKPDSDLGDISIALSELGGSELTRPVKPVDVSRPKAAIPKAQKPKYEKPKTIPSTVSTSTTYGTSRTGTSRISSQQPKVPFQPSAVSGSNENLKLINQQLIQRQNQEGVLQAFGGIVKSESDLSGLPVSLDQIGGFGQPKPIAPKVEYKQPVALPKPKVSTTTSRGQSVKYIGTGVSSGISGSSFTRAGPVRPVGGGSQGYSNQFGSGTVQGSYGANENIKLINRQLIQKQEQEGVLQAFGGIVKSESDLTGLPVSLDQIGGFGVRKPIAPKVEYRQPVAPKVEYRQPVALPKPKVSTTNSRGQSVKYTGTGVSSGISGSSFSRTSPVRPIIGGTQGYSNQIRSGTAQGLYGSNENIKLINRQLIQKQEQEGVLNAFGGIVKSESDLAGLPVSLDQIGGFGQPKPVAPKVQYKQPVALPKPKVSTSTSRGQTVKYTGTGVSSGISGTTFSRTSPVRPIGGITQGYSNQLGSATAQGSLYGSNENIKLINRQLIQKQEQEGVLKAFGGIVKSESDLTGLPVSLDQIGGFGVRKPISPKVEYRQPVAPKVEYRQPVALPKPKVSTTTSRGQSVKYTGTGVSSGISGSSFSSSSPVRPIIGGTQGYNNQFASSGAQGLYGSNENIKLINRQLIQRQEQEGVLNAFGGIVKSESDLTGLPVSLDQIGGFGQPKPIAPKIQYKQPVAVSKPRTPTRVVSSNTGKDQIVGYTGSRVTSGMLGPSAPRLTPVRGIIGTTQLKYTGTQATSGQTSSSFGTRNKPIQPVFGNAAGSISPSLSRTQQVSGPKPKPRTPANLSPQNEDIIALNRNLIQKQNEQGILQTFGGIAKNEADLDGVSVSLEELGDITKFGSLGAGIQQTPQAPKRPVSVAPKRPSLVASSQATGGVNQRAQGVGTQTGPQRFAPARISPQNIIPTSGNQRTATRTSSGINPSVSGGATAGIPSGSQSGLNEELRNLNRQLIEKQNREGIRQTFGGIVKNEEDLEGGLVYVDELDSITKLVGYNAPKDKGPQTSGYPASSGQGTARRPSAGQSQAQGGRFTPVEKSRVATGILPSGFLDQADQVQVKVEDVEDPSSLSQVLQDIPSIHNFKPVDVPVSNYSPPLKPLNYRTQTRTSASGSQNVQEQQKIEQVFV
ncbi:hypothetical protein JTE90_012815 [Oedothorax gibbosus]|uniref:Uncharacterized protein n=1 Tax=Oedothorax gibbosus TaxID=931172 RepID=A0AAV6W092_9ARAC|nr:hypothetical protein JTE90_012815 [Oedothorax gibbosus]